MFSFYLPKVLAAVEPGYSPTQMSISNSSWTEVQVEGILPAADMLGSPPLLKVKGI